MIQFLEFQHGDFSLTLCIRDPVKLPPPPPLVPPRANAAQGYKEGCKEPMMTVNLFRQRGSDTRL